MINSQDFNLAAWDRNVPSREEVSIAIAINGSNVDREAAAASEEVSAVMEQGDNPNPNETKDPKTFSLQPLAEAYKLAGGVAPQQREMSTQARVIESAVRDAEERVDAGAPLAESQDQSKPESLETGFDRTKAVMDNALRSSALFLQRQGNLTLSAQTGIRLSSLQGTTITGANTFLSTATTVINSQVSANASETIINLTDFSINRVNGSSVTHVEDTNQISTTNNITRATETSQTIANRNYNHGIELSSTTGSTILNTAGEGGHTVHSTGNVSTFTDSSVLTLATSEITMGAGSPTSNGPLPQADPDFSILDAIPQAASFMRIVSGANAAITSVTSGDSSIVSRGSQLVTAANTYVSAASTAAQVAGRQLMNGVMGTGGNPRSHVFHQGRMIIQGRMIGGFPSVDIDAVMFPTVPPLPPKPSAYSIEDLQACIPKSYRKGEEEWSDGQVTEEDTEANRVAESLGIDSATLRRNAGSASTSGATTTEVSPGNTGTEQDVVTTNSELASPSTSSSVTTSITQMMGATSAGGGPTNIYIDRFIDKEEREEDSNGVKEETAPQDQQDLIDYIWSQIEKDIPEDERGLAELIIRDLYSQGYRGDSQELLTEGYIAGVRETIKEKAPEYASVQLRTLVIDLMKRMDHVSPSTSMGMFQDLGGIAGISLPGIGSVGQIIQDSFGTSSIGTVIEGLTNIGSLSGISAESILDNLGLGDIDFSTITSPAELLDLVKNENISDLLRNESIRLGIERALGSSAAASSITSSISNIIRGGVALDQEQIDDLINNIIGIEGLSDKIPSNYLQLVRPLIDTALNGGQISLSQEEVLNVLSSIGGDSGPFKLLASYREVESIISNVTALTSIPDLLSLMQDNDVPILARASLLLSCLDIFNRVKSIAGSFGSILNTLGNLRLDGLPSQDKSLVEEALEATKKREEFVESTNSLSSIEPIEDKAPEIPDSVDTRIILLEGGYIRESIVIERGSNIYTIPTSLTVQNLSRSSIYTANFIVDESQFLDGVIYRNRAIDNSKDLYIQDNNFYIGINNSSSLNYVRKTGELFTYTELTGFKRASASEEKKTGVENNLYIRVEPLNFYKKEEIIRVWNNNNQEVWANKDWFVSDKEGEELSFERVRPISPTVIETIALPYVSYKRNSIRVGKDKQASSLIESLPKIIQFINLLDKSSYRDIQAAQRLGLSRGEADYLTLIKNVTVPQIKEVESSICFPIPKLDPYQSEVQILGIDKGLIRFRLVDSSIKVGSNVLIQLEALLYRRNQFEILSVESSDRYYNPTLINYRIKSYSLSEGIGVAYLETNQRIVLEDQTGTLFKYYTEDIGKKIMPEIRSSYLVL